MIRGRFVSAQELAVGCHASAACFVTEGRCRVTNDTSVPHRGSASDLPRDPPTSPTPHDMNWNQAWWHTTPAAHAHHWDWSNAASSWSGTSSGFDWSGADSRPGKGQPGQTRNSLTRRTTDEGKTYNHYTYLGGDTKASLPTCERAKIVLNLFEDSITMVRAQQWSSDCLDSIIYLATRSQPTTKIHSLSTDPTLLREMLLKEYKFRLKQGAPEVLDSILECGDRHELIINRAVTEGFMKLDVCQLRMGRVGAIIPRGKDVAPQMDTSEKLKQAEMAKVEARHQRETALLEYEIVQLQRLTAEEHAKQQEAVQQVTVTTNRMSPTTLARSPKQTFPARVSTPPRAAASANSPSAIADARAEAIARAATVRAAKLGDGHHVSASTANSATPPNKNVRSPESTVKAPAPPLAMPDAKRPRVATPVSSPGGKPAQGAANNCAVASTKPGAHAKEGGAGKGKANEACGREAKVAAGAATEVGRAKEMEGHGKEAKRAGGAVGDAGKGKGAEGHGKETSLARGADMGKATGKGNSKESDSRAQGLTPERGTRASAASDTAADGTTTGMPKTAGKAEVHKNNGEAKLVGNIGQVRDDDGTCDSNSDADTDHDKGEVEATEENGVAEEEEEEEDEDEANTDDGEENQGEVEDCEVEESEIEKSQREVQEAKVKATGLEDEGEENQGEVQEGDVEEANASRDTHDKAEAVATEGPEAEENMGEAAGDEDVGQVGAEEEAEDDNMDNAEGDAEVEDTNIG
jgi:hypothetical protein